MKTRATLPAAFRDLQRPSRYKLFHGGRGSGKCLAPGTRIIMADGSLRAIEDVQVGDEVMGPDSKPRLVFGTTTGFGPLYQVRQTSGMDYVVNDAHILTLRKSVSCVRETGETYRSGNLRRPNGRYPSWPAITDIAIPDYLQQSDRWKSHFRGFRAGVLQLAAQPVPVDPYFFGIWLGDGASDALAVTTPDREVIDACGAYAVSEGCSLSTSGEGDSLAVRIRMPRPPSTYTNPIWQKMRDLGVVSNKHIPECYLLNDEATRLALLAGLIDSDGYLHCGGYEIIQTREVLARQIKRLADGLGFRTSIREKATICGNNGVYGTAWRVSIGGDTWRIPCKVARRIVRECDLRKNKDWLLSQITVEPHGDGPYAGIAISGDGRFLLEDGTVTHNSTSFATVLIARAAAKPIRVLCCREFMSSIRDSVHQLLADRIEAMHLGDQFTVERASIRHRNGSVFVFSGLKYNATRIKSMENISIAWIEEAATISAHSLSVLVPTIRAPNSELWFSWNPELESDPIWDYVAHPRPDSIIKCVTFQDNQYFPEVLRREMLDLKERDYDQYQHVYQGKPRQTLMGAVYAQQLRDAVEAGRIGPVPYDPLKGVHVAVDLGFMDRTSMWLFQTVGREIRFIDFLEGAQQPIGAYLKQLQERNYVYDTIHLPPDARAKELGTGKSVEEIIRAAGFRIQIVRSLTIEDGINATRTTFPTLWFDETRCVDGLNHLKRYRYEVADNGAFSNRPVHDEASHSADALRYAIVAMTEKRTALYGSLEPPVFPNDLSGTSWMSR